MTYTWEWVGGGYNSCYATSREEALEKAKKLGAPKRLRDIGLQVDEETLVEDPGGKRRQAFDRAYEGMFL